MDPEAHYWHVVQKTRSYFYRERRCQPSEWQEVSFPRSGPIAPLAASVLCCVYPQARVTFVSGMNRDPGRHHGQKGVLLGRTLLSQNPSIKTFRLFPGYRKLARASGGGVKGFPSSSLGLLLQSNVSSCEQHQR